MLSFPSLEIMSLVTRSTTSLHCHKRAQARSCKTLEDTTDWARFGTGHHNWWPTMTAEEEETKGPSWPKSTRRPSTIPDLRVCMLLEEQIRIGLCCPTWEPAPWGYVTTEIFHPSHTDPWFSYRKMPRWVYEPPFSICELMKSEYTLHVSSGSLPCKARCALEDLTLSSETVGKEGHDWGDISLANWGFIARQIATLTPLCLRYLGSQLLWEPLPSVPQQRFWEQDTILQVINDWTGHRVHVSPQVPSFIVKQMLLLLTLHER